MSKTLKPRGFKYTGATVYYAFMQAVGMINDHIVDYFRYPDIRNYWSKGLIIPIFQILDNSFSNLGIYYLKFRHGNQEFISKSAALGIALSWLHSFFGITLCCIWASLYDSIVSIYCGRGRSSGKLLPSGWTHTFQGIKNRNPWTMWGWCLIFLHHTNFIIVNLKLCK